MSSAGQGLGRLLGFVTHIALANMYGAAQLGYYAIGIMVFADSPTSSRSSGWTTAWCAGFLTTGRRATRRGCAATVFQAIGVTFAFSLVLSAAMFLGAGIMARPPFEIPFMETMLRAFAPALPFFTLMSMTLWAIQGFQTVKYATLVREVLRPLANLTLIFVFYFLGVEILGAVAALHTLYGFRARRSRSTISGRSSRSCSTGR